MVFKQSLLNFIRPLQNKVHNPDNPEGLRLLTRLWLGPSQLGDYEFKSNFSDTIKPLCSCSSEVEMTSDFFSTAQTFWMEGLSIWVKLLKLAVSYQHVLILKYLILLYLATHYLINSITTEFVMLQLHLLFYGKGLMALFSILNGVWENE